MDTDRKLKAKEALAEAFIPMVKMLCRKTSDLEIFIEEKEHGVLPGLEINLRAHKHDSPRVWGKGRSMFNALAAIAESIGYMNRIPIRLGLLLDPVVGLDDKDEAAGRMFGDRKFPIEGKSPDEYLRCLLELVANQLFAGLSPKVKLEAGNSGVMRFIITMSPQNQKIVQRQWNALSVVWKAICAPYRWMPQIDIDQSMPLPERK